MAWALTAEVEAEAAVGGWGRSDEGHHRRHFGERIHRQQRNDDYRRDEDRVNKDGQWNRIPLLTAHLDRRVDNVAEHITWHERLLLTPTC